MPPNQPSLEVVHFSGAQAPVVAATELHPKVTTTRGNLPSEPLQLTPGITVEGFIADASLPCDVPALATPPQ